ncbi:MAG: hypothetical protein LH467_12895 [Gemmatimonadaceae bacterium]|nr:hypothetical protein [Gemmatimonadaceae bacterium]
MTKRLVRQASRFRRTFAATLVLGCGGGNGVPLQHLPEEPRTQARDEAIARAVQPAPRGTLLCASEVIEREKVGDTIREYVWVLCKEFGRPDAPSVVSSFSVPAVVVARDADSEYRVLEVGMAREGAARARDLDSLFPARVQGAPAYRDPDAQRPILERLERLIEARRRPR